MLGRTIEWFWRTLCTSAGRMFSRLNVWIGSFYLRQESPVALRECCWRSLNAAMRQAFRATNLSGAACLRERSLVRYRAPLMEVM